MSNDMAVGPSVVLSVRGVSKRYGPVKANDDITIEFRAGEIHALLGENGSGKSTPARHRQWHRAARRAARSRSPDSRCHGLTESGDGLGLGMAYQTMSEVAGLTVAENLYLARPCTTPPGVRSMEEWAAEQAAATTTSTSSAAHAHRDPVACPTTDARGRASAAVAAEGAAARRAHDCTRPRRRRPAAPADPRSRRPTASGSSTSATACPRCSRWPRGSRCCATA